MVVGEGGGFVAEGLTEGVGEEELDGWDEAEVHHLVDLIQHEELEKDTNGFSGSCRGGILCGLVIEVGEEDGPAVDEINQTAGRGNNDVAPARVNISDLIDNHGSSIDGAYTQLGERICGQNCWLQSRIGGDMVHGLIWIVRGRL